MYGAKLAIFLIVPLLFDPCTATDEGNAMADDAMADANVETEELMADDAMADEGVETEELMEHDAMAEDAVSVADDSVESSHDEAMASTTGGPRWSTQPDKTPACSPGVCGAGSWIAFLEGKTYDECKSMCEGARMLVPEPDGITEKAYKFRQNGRWQDVSKRTPTFERKVPKIQYRGTGGYWDKMFQSKGMRDHFYMRWEGYVEVKQKGKYTFWTVSDDGSRLYVNGKSVVNNPGWHGMRWREGSKELDAGKHAFWAEVFEGGGGAGMEWYYRGPDTSNKRIIVPPTVLSSSLQAGKSQPLMLPDYGFGDKLCAGFSHQGSKCVVYDNCANIDPKADNIVGDTSFDWAGDSAGYQTCKYSQHAPDL